MQKNQKIFKFFFSHVREEFLEISFLVFHAFEKSSKDTSGAQKKIYEKIETHNKNLQPTNEKNEKYRDFLITFDTCIFCLSKIIYTHYENIQIIKILYN